MSEQHAKPMVYIGEAEVVITRLQQHNSSKDFWNYAIAITSNNKHLTKTHVKFLEWLCHNRAATANRCALENGNIPTKPHTPESTEADLYDNFETIDLLASTLGLNIFQPLAAKRVDNNTANDSPDIFEYKSASERGLQFEATGKYTDEGFIVFAGSKFSNKIAPSFIETGKRKALIRDEIATDNGDYLLLKEDVLFDTPSAAGDAVAGRSTNGWTAWKRKNGKTLDEVYRKVAV